jgi:cysteine-rich repeat protein
VRKLVRVFLLAVVLSIGPAIAVAVDLNGKWRFESSPSMIVVITQSGSDLTIPYGFPFTGTIGTPDVNGFTSYQVSWTDGTNQAGFGGRVMPSGNLLDGRGAGYFPPNPPSAGPVVATRCTCDDGNSVNGDGCDDKCQVELCWTCSGDPSVCVPTSDGGACDDGSPCTTGETCTSGVCGGGTPVVPCFDLSGPWTRHHSLPELGTMTDTATTISQSGTDLRIDSYVGTIDPVTGAFDIRAANSNFFCASFDPMTGSVAADGLTYSATGSIQEPNPFAPDHCDQFSVTEIGDHCGDGNLDGTEQCDDGNLVNGDGCSAQCVVEQCWTCSGQPSSCMPLPGSSCDDGDACTTGDTCASDGSCGGTSLACGPCLTCDVTLGCVAQVQSPCKASTAPEKALVQLKNVSDDTKDRFAWLWNKGADTMLAELGDPPGGDDVSVCVYDESITTPVLLFRASLPDGTSWVPTASGFLYKSDTATPEGATVGKLKEGAAGKAKAKVKGKGAHLSDRAYRLPALPLPLPLRVQLRGENGLCLETRHDTSSVLKNDPASGVFKARGIP